MAILISYALSPINYLLTLLCLNKHIYSIIESLINDDDLFHYFVFLDGKRFKFALFSWIFLEAVFVMEQILVGAYIRLCVFSRLHQKGSVVLTCLLCRYWE